MKRTFISDVKAGEKVIGTKYYPVCVDKGGKIL